LIGEISSFFSLEESESEKVIGRWVEDTLQMMVTGTILQHVLSGFVLRIPSN